jgi:RNA polymerase sigma-70 factor (ECF subfamily)
VRAWLFAIERNLFLTGLRRRARQAPQVSFEDLPSPPSVDGSQESLAGLRDVLSALDALPEEQRSVLLLVGVEDLSYEEAARVLGVPIGTVMSRLSRARDRVRRFLEAGRGVTLRRVK